MCIKKLLLIFLLCYLNIAYTNDLEDALSGFDEPSNQSKDTILDEQLLKNGIDAEKNPNWYSISGYMSFLSAYNYAQKSQSIVAPGDLSMDFSELSRARAKLNLALDMKHTNNWKSRIEVIAWHDLSWAIKGRNNYIDEVLNSYENFTDIKEAYIQGSLTESLDIKFGRQVVIWGKSDSIRITDIINPLDNRELGMVDIKDLRLSEFMTKIDYYFGDFALSTLIIHEPRLEIEAAFGSDYRPADVFGSPIPYAFFPAQKRVDWGLENTQFAAALDGHFEGWDLSLYSARVLDSSRFGVEKTTTEIIRNYSPINMMGIAVNMVKGAWLFKTEGAYINGVNYRSTTKKNRLDTLLGFDYMGIKNTVLSVELANRHIFNYEEQMLSMSLEEAKPLNTFPDFVRKDSVQIALRGAYNFDYDNASINYLISLLGSSRFTFEDGGFQRLWVTYKYSDAILLESGVVDYLGGNNEIPFFNSLKYNDRFYAQISYNF